MTYKVGFIGTGANTDKPDTDGYAMAYQHAAGYERLSECEIVACADIVRENAEAFAEVHDIDAQHVYEDYEDMVKEAGLDIVSVCTPPSVHADLVIGTAELADVKAIHCEKPMADTWGDCKRMAQVCDERGVRLTINHQMRFGKPFREAKALIDEGRIGNIRRFEFGNTTLFDMGSHLFDLCNYFNDYAPVEWVLAQIDYSEKNLMFGTHNENQAVSQWYYGNDAYGLASTGRGDGFLNCFFRILGSDGTIEIGSENAMLRVGRDGKGWRTIETGVDNIHDAYPNLKHKGLQYLTGKISSRLRDRFDVPGYTDRAIEEIVSSLKDDERSELSASLALSAQEIIFASWESSRRRGRVKLPLEISDNPLKAMVESGDLVLES